MDRNTLIAKLKHEISQNNLVIITGTGISISSSNSQEIEGFKIASWSGLLSHGVKHCSDIGLVSDQNRLVLNEQISSGDIGQILTAAEEITQYLSGRSAGVYKGWLQETIGMLSVHDSTLIDAIAGIPGILATLNYDTLIESATGRQSVNWMQSEETQKVIRSERGQSVLHLHGDWRNPESVILGHQSYQHVKEDLHAQSVLRSLVIQGTIVFIGCGDTVLDPNFGQLIEWAAAALQDVIPRHYFLCRTSERRSLQSKLSQAPWIQLLDYGEEYEDLAPFLRSLNEEVLGPSNLSKSAIFSPTPKTRASQEAGISIGLLSELEATNNERINRVRDLIRAGKSQEAEADLRTLQTTESWSLLAPDVKARVWRILGGLALSRHNDAIAARNYLEKAREENPSGRTLVLEASIVDAEYGPETALKLLADPLDRDEWHLKIVLLMNSDRMELARRHLDTSSFVADEETDRLRALAFLYYGEIDKARRAISRALSINAKVKLSLQTDAFIEYFSTVSTSFDGWKHWIWPLPPKWRHVKQEVEAQKALNRAANYFSERSIEVYEDQTEWENNAIWHLACLANGPATQQGASELVRSILKINPISVPAIAWAVERGYEFPRERTVKLLEEVCGGELDSIGPVQALFRLLAVQGKHSEAGLLLDNKFNLFETLGMVDDWASQRAQVFLIEGHSDKAVGLIDKMGSPELKLSFRSIVAHYEASKSGWTRELATILDEEYSRDKSASSLYDSCAAHLSAGDPGYVVRNAELLLDKMKTETALRLAIEAAAADMMFAFCVHLSETRREFFKEGELPPEVRRIRAYCFRKQGMLAEAEVELEYLASITGDRDARLGLLDLQIITGKVTEASATARHFLHDSTLTGDTLFSIAEKLRANDPELAKTFFARGTKQGVISSQGAAIALQVGFPLGMDDQLAELMKKAMAGLGAPGAAFSGFTFEQLIERQREWNESRFDAEEEYRFGRTPIHLLSRRINLPLAAFYHTQLEANKNTARPPHHRWSLRIRYGTSRYSTDKILEGPKRIFLDVTSILLAQHLGMLEILETHFAPIAISPWVTETLNEQIESFSSEQVSRVVARKEVIDRVSGGQLKILADEHLSPDDNHPMIREMGSEWCSMLSYAIAGAGVVVDFFPLTTNDGTMSQVDLPEIFRGAVISPADIVNALEEGGNLTEAQTQLAKIRLGKIELSPTPIDLANIKILVLQDGVAEQLAVTGLLGILSEQVTILVRKSEVTDLRQQIKLSDNQIESTAWLKNLRERLRNGIDVHLYETRPNPKLKELPGTENWSDMRCLRDLLDETRGAEYLSVCDDRLINRYTKVGDSQLVGIVDVFWLLKRMGKMPFETFYASLNELRAENVKYLLPLKDEILHFVRKARIHGGQIVESSELATLRRYGAACLLDTSSFQHLPIDHPEVYENSEILFLTRWQRCVCDAIGSIWASGGDEQKFAVARSNWILDALWFDLSAMPTFASPPAEPNSTAFGMSEVQLILQILSISKNWADNDLIREKQFLDWLFSRLGHDKHRLIFVVKELKKSFSSLLRGHKTLAEKAVAQRIVGRVLECLPEVVRNFIALSNSEMRNYGLKHYSPVSFKDVEFDGRELWPVARKAFNGKVASIASKFPKGKVFSISRASEKVLTFSSEDGTSNFQVSDLAIGILNDNAFARLQHIEDCRSHLDLSAREAGKILPLLNSMKRVDLRIRRYFELQSESYGATLTHISTSLSSSKQFDLTLLRSQTIGGLLQHLRLPLSFGDSELPKLIGKSFKILLDEEGFKEAFERIGSLPLELSPRVHEAFKSLSAEERVRLKEDYSKSRIPALLRFHTAVLFLGGDRLEKDWAVDTLAKLAADEAEGEAKTFRIILDWAAACLATNPNEGQPTVAMELAATWIHAGRVSQVFSLPIYYEEIGKVFLENTPGRGSSFFKVSHVEHDVSASHRFNRVRFFVSGISECLRDNRLENDIKNRVISILEALVFPFEDSDLVALPLIEQIDTSPNALCSFLGPPNVKNLVKVLGISSSSRFSSSVVQTEVDDVLKLVVLEPLNVSAWIFLAMRLNEQIPTESQRTALGQIIADVSFKDYASFSYKEVQAIATVIFRQIIYLEGESVRNVGESKLIELAQLLSSPGFNEEANAAALLIGDFAFRVSLLEASESASASQFVRLILRVVQVNEQFAKILLTPVTRILLCQPAEISAGMWKEYIELRSFTPRF